MQQLKNIQMIKFNLKNLLKLSLLFLLIDISFAEEKVNSGFCAGHSISECEWMTKEIYSKQEPVYCKENKNYNFGTLDKKVCDFRNSRKNELASSDYLQRIKDDADDRSALISEYFEKVVDLIKNISISAHCDYSDKLMANRALMKINYEMHKKVFDSRIGPEQGIYPEEIFKNAIDYGRDKSTEEFCKSLSSSWKARIRNIIYELNR